MRKNLTIGVLVAVLVVLVVSDVSLRTDSDGAWCAWWRVNVKVCNVDVDRAKDYARADCSTDGECAAWEVAHNIPVADRSYGDPVPVKGR